MKKNDIPPWAVNTWGIPPQADAEFVFRREDGLATYQLPYDPEMPVVCLDESNKPWIGEVATPLPPLPGQLKRVDDEDERLGVCHPCMGCEPLRGWRHGEVTERRTKQDWAEGIHAWVDVYDPQAHTIRLVLDNVNTHTGASLYEAFAPQEARRGWEKLEFHDTPKQASWLNMAEIERGILGGQCLDRRIDDIEEMRQEIAAWEQVRNAKQAKIHGTFTMACAREKLKKLYPSIQD